MAWWGKLVGGAFGFMAMGPLGAVLGAALGHKLDKGLNLDFNSERMAGDGSGDSLGGDDQERIQTAFFTATFSVLGHIAKADGRVTPDEIKAAQSIMAQMQLNEPQRKTAIALFNQGKQDDFPLDEVMEQFRRECQRRRDLFRMFLEIQVHGAYADGEIHGNERRILERLCRRLRLPIHELTQIEALIRAAAGDAQYQHHAGGGYRGAQSAPSLEDDYAVLGVSEDDDKTTIKRAYRRKMSQHHPDKLVSKGLPEEMIKLAEGKTVEIRQAYERILKARNF